MMPRRGEKFAYVSSYLPPLQRSAAQDDASCFASSLPMIVLRASRQERDDDDEINFIKKNRANDLVYVALRSVVPLVRGAVALGCPPCSVCQSSLVLQVSAGQLFRCRSICWHLRDTIALSNHMVERIGYIPQNLQL